VVSKITSLSVLQAIKKAGGKIYYKNDDLVVEFTDGGNDQLIDAFHEHKDNLKILLRPRAQSHAPALGQDLRVAPCQEGLLRSKLLNPLVPTNCTYAYLITEDVNTRRLKQIYELALSNYDALKLGLKIENFEGCWLPNDHLGVDINVTKHDTVDANKAVIDSFVEQASRSSFDLHSGACGRIDIISFKNNKTLIIETFDHMLVDGRSLSILHQDITQLYSDSSPRAERNKYVTYLNGCRRTDQNVTAFWKNMFKGYQWIHPATDHKQSETKEVLSLSVHDIQKIKQKCQEMNVTLPSLIFAAHCHAISRYTATSDITSFIALDGCTADHENTFGHMTHLLPVRVNHNWTDNLSEHINKVSRCLANVRDNINVPIEILTNCGAPVSLNSSAANAFIFQDQTSTPPQIFGKLTRSIEGKSLYQAGGVTTIARKTEEGGLNIELRFSDQCSFSALSKGFVKTLDIFLKLTASAPSSKLLTPKLIPKNSFKKINLPSLLNPSEVLTSLFTSLEANNSELLQHLDRSYTRAELFEQVSQLLPKLRQLASDDYVAVIVDVQNPFDRISAFLSILLLGFTYVPLGEEPETIKELKTSESGASIIIDQLGVRKITPKRRFADIVREQKWNANENNLPAYIIFTSGTTGVPKGVVVGYSSLLTFAHGEGERFNITQKSNVLLIAPPIFDPWIAHVLGSLISGAKLTAIDAKTSDLSNTMESKKVTHAFLPAVLLKHIRDNIPTHLEMVASAGDNCKFDDIAPFIKSGIRTFNIYGPTEATITALYKEFKSEQNTEITIGQPISGINAEIMYDGLAIAPLGVKGEIVLSGNGVALGYLGHVVRSGFTESHPTLIGQAYFTGDIGWRGNDGEFRICGRVDRQVKIRGFRIELSQLETTARTSETVQDARAVMIKGKGSGHLILFYEGEETKQGLMQIFENQLPEFYKPRDFIKLTTIPIKDSGKYDDTQLTKIYAMQQESINLNKRNIASDDKVFQILFDTWVSALGQKPHMDSDFFAMGGDSLVALTFVRNIRQRGLQISIHEVYSHSSFDEIYLLLKTQRETRSYRNHDNDKILPLNASQSWFFSLPLKKPNEWVQRAFFDTDTPISEKQLGLFLDKMRTKYPALRCHIKPDGNFLNVPSKSKSRIIPLYGNFDSSDIEAAYTNLLNWLEPGRGQTMGAVLCNKEASGSGVLFVIHHLAVDEWSWNIIKDDFKDWLSEVPTTPSDSDYAFANSTHSIREALSGGAYDLDRQYWGNILKSGITGRANRGIECDETSIASLSSSAVLDISRRYNVSNTAALLGLLAGSLNVVEPDTNSIIDIERNGRNAFPDFDTSNSIGWFGLHHPILLPHSVVSRQSCEFIETQLQTPSASGMSYMALRFIRGIDFGKRVARFSVNVVSGKDGYTSTSSLSKTVMSSVSNGRSKENLLPYSASFSFTISNSETRLKVDYAGSQFSTKKMSRLLNHFSDLDSIRPAKIPNPALPTLPLSLPVNAMQHLMLAHSQSGIGRYLPKLVIKLDKYSSANAPFFKQLEKNLTNFSPFKWRFQKVGNTYEQTFNLQNQLDIKWTEGSYDKAKKWYLSEDNKFRDGILTGGPTCQVMVVGDPIKKCSYICLEFHHAIIDGSAMGALLEAIRPSTVQNIHSRTTYVDDITTFKALKAHISDENSQSNWRLDDTPIKTNKLIGQYKNETVTIKGEAFQQIIEFAKSKRVGLKSIFGAAALMLSTNKMSSHSVQFVTNIRNSMNKTKAKSYGLYWSFLDVAPLKAEYEKNLEVAHLSSAFDISKFGSKTIDLFKSDAEISFNYIKDNTEKSDEAHNRVLFSRDIFHHNVQIQVSELTNDSFEVIIRVFVPKTATSSEAISLIDFLNYLPCDITYMDKPKPYL